MSEPDPTPLPTPEPDLALIPDLIVARLRAFPDLAPLTKTEEDGTVVSGIVGINRADLVSAIQAAEAAFSVSVTVLVVDAIPKIQQSKALVYDRVNVLIEISELVEMNQTTPDSAVPGTGSGMQAWKIADRMMAALVNWSLPMARPYRLLPTPEGIKNTTTEEDALKGYKVLRGHFYTVCEGIARAD